MDLAEMILLDFYPIIYKKIFFFEHKSAAKSTLLTSQRLIPEPGYTARRALSEFDGPGAPKPPKINNLAKLSLEVESSTLDYKSASKATLLASQRLIPELGYGGKLVMLVREHIQISQFRGRSQNICVF